MRARLGSRFFKGIQVDDHHVDGRNAMLGDRRAMAAIFTAIENASVNLGM